MMNVERSVLTAMAFVFTSALPAFDAAAMTSRDCGGASLGTAAAARVLDGRSFVLVDGREVRLAAIEATLPVPGDEDEARVAAAQAAKTALETMLLNREIELSVTGAGSDRYGRLTAWVFVRGASASSPSEEVLVQHEMVAAGHALVSPIPSSPCRAYLRAAETQARADQRGLWGASYSMMKEASDPADILADQGRFALVHGKVTSVRESGGLLYINFGHHWSSQFTATLLKRHEGAFAAPRSLAGHTIEVRGFIEERGGPAVEVTRPEQIEIIH